MEEPKSEKSVLLDHPRCTDDAAFSTIKKDIAATESDLSKLEKQEEKYPSELEAALSEYAVLKEQGADFDPAKLYAQRKILSSEKSSDAAYRIQSAYGEKYDPLILFDSKRDVDELLLEDVEDRAYRKEQNHKRQENRGKE